MQFSDIENFKFVNGIPIYVSNSLTYAEKLKNGLLLDELCYAQITPPPSAPYVYTINSTPNLYQNKPNDLSKYDEIEYNKIYYVNDLSIKKEKWRYKKEIFNVDNIENEDNPDALIAKRNNKKKEKEQRARQKKNMKLIGFDQKNKYIEINTLYNDKNKIFANLDLPNKVYTTLYCIPVYSKEHVFEKIYSYSKTVLYYLQTKFEIYKHINKPIFFIHCDSDLHIITQYAKFNHVYLLNSNDIINKEILFNFSELCKYLPELNPIYEKMKGYLKNEYFCIFYLYKHTTNDHPSSFYYDKSYPLFLSRLNRAKKTQYYYDKITQIPVSKSKYYKTKKQTAITDKKYSSKQELFNHVFFETYLRMSNLNIQFKSVYLFLNIEMYDYDCGCYMEHSSCYCGNYGLLSGQFP